MLTEYDITVMEDSVREIIAMWNTKLTILKPLPIEDQINWNIHMHEYSGEIQYTQYNNIIAERKDQSNTKMYNLNIYDGAGDNKDGNLIFTISDLYTFIDDTCRIIYDDVHWKILEIKERIGEKLLILIKVVGSDEKWSEIPDSIIDIEVV